MSFDIVVIDDVEGFVVNFMGVDGCFYLVVCMGVIGFWEYVVY